MVKLARILGLVILSFALAFCWGCGGFQQGRAETTEHFNAILPEQLLKMAEDRVKAGNYDAALRTYDEFEKSHPGNKLLPYCIFGRGLCYFQQRGTIDRDQTFSYKAALEFRRLKERFPNWQYTPEAEKHLAQCLRDLAEHEFCVGTFYFRTGHYQAALVRFQGLIRDYPGFSKTAEAQKCIAECEKQLAAGKKPKGFIARLFDAQW